MSREPHIDLAARPDAAYADRSAASAASAAPERATEQQPRVEPVYCPECGLPAWVEWTDSAQSTSGPVEHVKVRCFSRHWFLMPREYLDR